ncbi:AAA family ATPase [Mariprofundus ferrooxydans]|uniref:AAA family ATPase n=1 Tax=Mariprofundus ferrooxydans TaxID=314344 RepID=UPI0014302E5D|nr:AAA family ATPase [Mariprofundus ferrooxydans]
MQFRILPAGNYVPDSGKETIYLRIDHWNDYSFTTMFDLSLHDEQGQFHDIGKIKIGFKEQTEEITTHKKLTGDSEESSYTIKDELSNALSDEFFSLGQSIEYYEAIASLPNDLGNRILHNLRDLVVQPGLIEEIKDEKVFGTSLLRDVSLSVIKGQFARVLEGKVALTDFKLKFVRSETEHFGVMELDFDVEVDSTPSTNIHAIIGRNGVGKTTLLNGMIEAITDRQNVNTKFVDTEGWHETKISDDYFSSLVSVSFSAFDPFTPPHEQPDPARGTCYFYIGLKDTQNGELHRTISDLQNDCVKALISCFYKPKKTELWLSAIGKLGSDEIFSSMNLRQLETIYRDLRANADSEEQSDSDLFRNKYREAVTSFLSRMSSGHAIVLLTVTRLVSTVEEKTLVLLDEPESHLHPPLLSAFVRALADLLYDRNGVAIIATHSPVVLQEIPRSCVWKIYRVDSDVTISRPEIETFGENVGVLTSEVFRLEVERSGFHDLLAKSVDTGRTYEEIVADYDNQLGFEGRAILKVLITNRDRNSSHDATE